MNTKIFAILTIALMTATACGTEEQVDECNNACVDDSNPCNGIEACNTDTGQCTQVILITCEAWETCQELDGVCIGDDPCDPSPCSNGTCDNSTGSAVCTCTCDSAFCWSGSACDTCAAGFVGTDCHANWCESNTCDNGGTCTAEACDCSATGGYSGTYCEVPPAPTITAPALSCATTFCDVFQTYTGSFTYTGPASAINVYCTVSIAGPTPCTILDLTYSNGVGSYTYDPTPNGGGNQETIHFELITPDSDPAVAAQTEITHDVL